MGPKASRAGDREVRPDGQRGEDVIRDSASWTSCCRVCFSNVPQPGETPKRMKTVFWSRDVGNPCKNGGGCFLCCLELCYDTLSRSHEVTSLELRVAPLPLEASVLRPSRSQRCLIQRCGCLHARETRSSQAFRVCQSMRHIFEHAASRIASTFKRFVLPCQ